MCARGEGGEAKKGRQGKEGRCKLERKGGG